MANVAHSKLGLIELCRDNEEAAVKHLRDATPAVPRVCFWREGLNMELAQELSQRGLAEDAVGEYVSIALAYKPDDPKAMELNERLSATG